MTPDQSKLRWQRQVPTEQGWYWIQYPGGRKAMWFFDCSDWDINELSKADKFYGPIKPPEDIDD